MEMEGTSEAQSALPGTSKDVGKDAVSSPGALATPLHGNKSTISPTKTSTLPYNYSDSAQISTRYRTTLCEPEFLNLIKSSETSEIDPSTETELDQDRVIQTSDGLELVKSPDLVPGTSFASLFAPIGKHSSHSANSSTFRVQGFQNFNNDGASEKVYTIVSGQATDSSTASSSARLRITLFSDFFSLQARNDFFREIAMAQYAVPPNMNGALSLCIFEFPAQEPPTGSSPTDPKTWEFGFKASIFQHSQRNSLTKQNSLIRYKLTADQRTFKEFHGVQHKEHRDNVAWYGIASIINPHLKTEAVSPGFEKLAADFFGGKEVREDCYYGADGKFRLIDGPVGTKNHVITYSGYQNSQDIWDECHGDSGFLRFLIDVAMCNDMEKARLQGSRWYNAKVSCFAINDKSTNNELSALLDLLKGQGKANLKPFESEEFNTSGGAEDPNALSIYEIEFPTCIKDSGAANASKTTPTVHKEPKSKEQSCDEDDDWMNSNTDQQGNASKKASKKRNKNRNKASKMNFTQAKSSLDTDPDDKSSISKEPEAVVNTNASIPSFNEEPTGDWSVVPTKARPWHSHSQNSSSTAVGAVRGHSGDQFRQPGPVSVHNRSSHIPSGSPSAQFRRRDTSNATAPKNVAAQGLFVTSNSGPTLPQNAFGNQESQKPLQTQKPAPKAPEVSRTFIPEEYPALISKTSTAVSSSFVKPASHTGPRTQPVKNSTTVGDENQSLQGSASILIKPTIEKLLTSHAADSSTATTSDTDSGNSSARIGHEDIALEGDDQEDSTSTITPQNLYQAEEVESSEDGENSQHLSATLQIDVVELPEIGLNAESKTSKNQGGRETMPEAIPVAEVQVLSSFQNKDECGTSGAACDRSEASGDDALSVLIFTSPSQHKHRVTFPSNSTLIENGCESISSGYSPSTLKAQSTSNPSIQFEDGEAEIVHEIEDSNQDGSSASPEPDGGQNINGTSSAATEEESINFAGPSTRAPGLTVCTPSHLLLTEEEASGVVSTKKIKIHSAIHVPNGVTIPNFYYISSDSDDCDIGKATSKAKSVKVASSNVPKVRSATHSAKTGKAIPNFFYVSEDDDDSDTGRIPDDGHIQETTSPSHTEATASFAPGLETDPPPPYDNQAQEVVSLPFIPNEAVPNDEMRHTLLHANHTQLMNQVPFMAISDDRLSLALPNGNHTREEQASITTATTSDARMSPPITNENDEQYYTCPRDAESAPDGHAMDETASSLSSGQGKRLSIPNGGSSHQPLYSEYLESVENSVAYKPHDPSYAGQSDEAAYHPQFPDPRFPMAPPTPDFCQGQLVPDQRHLEVHGHAHESFGSGVETFQPILQRDSPHKQTEGQYAGDGTVDSQDLGCSRGPSPADSGRMVTQSQTASQFAANCTSCGERTIPSTQTPQVLCAGCGPNSMIRYCSAACLLVDSFAHADHCMNYAASDRAAFHSLPGMFIYVAHPIISQLGHVESPERFRQRAFSMHCSSGAFPRLFMAWIKKSNVLLPSSLQIDLNETIKRTGDYAVFRSNLTLNPPRNNPNADVIYTIKFHRDDPKKQMVTRTLNACYLVWDSRIIEFLFRLLRHFILDPEYFSIFKYNEPLAVVWPEFEQQFKREFNFDSAMQTCTAPFNGGIEWEYISGLIANLEYQYPVLSRWFNH